MKKLRPDGRLSSCASFVREGSRLADIGTDHGYLPIALCRSGRIPLALACDVNPLPLRSAEENITKFGLNERIRTRLSDGLDEVHPDEADDIVIAGMGGELIADILSRCEWIKDTKKRLILQPMTRHDALIRFLYENGFLIEAQEAAYDGGKYYTVLCVRYDGVVRPCDAYTAAVGCLRPDSKAAVGFLTKVRNQLKKQAIGDPSLTPVVTKIEELLT